MKLRALATSAALGLTLVGALAPESVEARKQNEYRYPFNHVWNAALRMVRVDMHMPVTDRDQDAGYLLFEYVEGEHRHTGSIELIAAEKDKRPVVTAVVSVGGMPSYVEQMMLDRLEKKLEAEYGAPMEPPPEEKPPESAPDKKPGKKPEREPEEGDAPIADPPEDAPKERPGKKKELDL